LSSDLSGISNQLATNVKQLTYDAPEETKQYQLQSIDRHDIGKSLSVADQQFLIKNIKSYHDSKLAIDELVDHKVLVTPVPIKLQTMLEKKLLIKNFKECVDCYNEWVDKNKIGVPYTLDDIDNSAQEEIVKWHAQHLLN
jgi:hypothetical protein